VHRVAPAPIPRLLQLERNTRERLGEAPGPQWLGEAFALEEDLRHLAAKKRQVERQLQHAVEEMTGPDALASSPLRENARFMRLL
jgi:hypothetical protein